MLEPRSPWRGAALAHDDIDQPYQEPKALLVRIAWLASGSRERAHGGTTAERAKSIHGRTGELLNMKKAAGKPTSKPSHTGADSFLDELNEAHRLHGRLHANVHDLKEGSGCWNRT